MSFPVFKLQSKKRSFNLRPHIEPHVRISRMLLSFQPLEKFDQNASQILTIIRHANKLFCSAKTFTKKPCFFGKAFFFKERFASNFPKWREGRRSAHPTSGSLAIWAEDRLGRFKNV